MLFCRKCKTELVEGINWYVSSKKNHIYLCIQCVRVQANEWRAVNLEKFNERSARYQRVYSKVHPEYHKRYYEKNKDLILKRARTQSNNIRIEVLSHYSKGILKCACCGEALLEFLCIDHINGDGEKHRKLIGISAGRAFYHWLKNNNYPNGFRVLCHNCNCAKGFYGYCPHERKNI